MLSVRDIETKRFREARPATKKKRSKRFSTR